MQLKLNIHRRHFLAAIHLLLVTLLGLTAQGQATAQDVFAPVPASLRARLVERLKLLVEYQRTQQWGKQYDLLSVLVTQGDTKEDHVERLRRLYAEGLGDALMDFTPKSVTYQGGGPSDVVVFGCVRLRQKGGSAEFYGAVEAYREKDDWYFSPVGIVTAVGGAPEPCPYSSATAANPDLVQGKLSKKISQCRQPL